MLEQERSLRSAGIQLLGKQAVYLPAKKKTSKSRARIRITRPVA